MRVKRIIQPPTAIRLGNILDVDELYGIAAPDLAEDPDEVITTEVFQKLLPGDERVCIILRADGLTYAAIGHIMGKSESQVKNIIYNVRKRLIKEQLI